MNILDKIKKNWNHKESVEQNVIRFSNEQEQRQRRIKKWYPLFIFLFILACLVFLINPLVGICLMIGTISFGSESVFKSATTSDTHIAVLDSTHFVLVYSSGGYKSVIGTISGSSISYGSEYTAPGLAYGTIDVLDSTHFVIAYRGDTEKGTCVIGTVSSGNEISYGTAAEFDTSNTLSTYKRAAIVKKISSTSFIVLYMVRNAGKVVIGTVSSGNTINYGSVSNTNRYTTNGDIAVLDSTYFVIVFADWLSGYFASAIIGTMSGNSITGYGPLSEFCCQNYNLCRAEKIDSTHFIVLFNNSNTYRLQCVIATRASTSISYGDTYEPFTGSASDTNLILLDSTHFVLQVENQVKLGTISNTDEITFETAVGFNSGGSINYSGMYKISDTDFVLSYVDVNNSNYGTVIIGTNPPPVVAPTVTTQSADQIATTSVRGNGNITATGGANCTRRGFCYKAGTSGDPTTSDSVAYDDGSFGTGAFTKSITGLTAGTDYRVRAYATNSAGTGYGSTITVTTPQSFTASVQPITSSLKDPSVNTLQQVDVSTQSLISTLKSSVINYDFVQSVLAQPLTATINDFNIIVGQIVYINPLSLSASTQSPSVTYDYVLNLNTQTLTLSKISPEAHYDYFIGVLKQELNTSLKSPSLTYDYALEVTKQELSLSQETPEIHYDFTLTLTVQSLTLEEQEPQIDILKQVFVDALSAILTLNDPQNKIIQSITDWKPNLKITNIKSRLK